MTKNTLNKRHGRHLPDRSIIQYLSLGLQRDPPVFVDRTPLLPTACYTPSLRTSFLPSSHHHRRTHSIAISAHFNRTSCIERHTRDWKARCKERVPNCWRLQHILHHADSETVAVVFWRCDGGFVFSAIFDPRFEFLVPGVGAYAI